MSVIGFGGIPIIAIPSHEAVNVARYALEVGINYFDTARAYGDSEEKIGTALKDVRDEVFIATKVPWQRTREDAARIGLKQSLRNLQTDRIDLVQLHGIDSNQLLQKTLAPDGSLAALKRARAQGQIDYVGITGHNPYVLVEAIRTQEFDTVLVPLNTLDRRAAETLIPLANELGLGIIIMKAMGGCQSPLQYPQRDARFLGKPELDWPDASEFISHFGRDGVERAQFSLRFALAHDIDTVVPGFRSTEEIDLAVKVANDLEGHALAEKTGHSLAELPSEPFCRECGMCMPCSYGLDIPTILRWGAYHTFYGIERWTRAQYQRLPTRVRDCTECRECETKCPYHLPVINMLRMTEKAFG